MSTATGQICAPNQHPMDKLKKVCLRCKRSEAEIEAATTACPHTHKNEATMQCRQCGEYWLRVVAEHPEKAQPAVKEVKPGDTVGDGKALPAAEPSKVVNGVLVPGEIAEKLQGAELEKHARQVEKVENTHHYYCLANNCGRRNILPPLWRSGEDEYFIDQCRDCKALVKIHKKSLLVWIMQEDKPDPRNVPAPEPLSPKEAEANQLNRPGYEVYQREMAKLEAKGKEPAGRCVTQVPVYDEAGKKIVGYDVKVLLDGPAAPPIPPASPTYGMSELYQHFRQWIKAQDMVKFLTEHFGPCECALIAEGIAPALHLPREIAAHLGEGGSIEWTQRTGDEECDLAGIRWRPHWPTVMIHGYVSPATLRALADHMERCKQEKKA